MRRLFTYLFTLMLAFGMGVLPLHAEKAKSDKKEQASSSQKIDVNTASQAELESLPGIGPATAGRIMAERPFKSLQDLERAGLSESEIKKLKSKAKAGRAAANSGSREDEEDRTSRAKKSKNDDDGNSSRDSKHDHARQNQQSSQDPHDKGGAGKVDINSASAEELETLPGVGPATAEKIIAGLPYHSKAELKASGISEATLEKIYPLVVARRGSNAGNSGRESGSEARSPEIPTSPPQREQARDLPQSDVEADESASDAAARVPPAAGMVWVNSDSGLFHREGDHWFGRTKEGKFMYEKDAVREGCREAWSQTEKRQ